ncbi:MAG: malto-oligosyltrehalose trehalohydrolase [Gordonia sp.]|nr:malto-oligosyltrehalose trehalohydrolase [Gordonia sp. (in: high G+C Gram-positive bacteria)]
MADIAVWGPLAQHVDLHVELPDGVRVVGLVRDDDDWWSVPAKTAGELGSPADGVRYAFAVDGGDPVPDPRSLRLPEGVHGWSQVHTPPAPAPWSGRALDGDVIYELHIGTFTPGGTFDSAVDRLDHLVELGVGFVEVLPVNAFNGEHGWGYDGVGWFAVHEPYGGPDGLIRFVDACHARGLGVIVDAVYNHLGPSGNHLPEFGPYFTGGANNWGSTINLAEADSDEVRAYIMASVLRWFHDFGADALRLDAVHALVDHRAVHILEELSVRVAELSHELGRPLSLIAESDLNDPRLITSWTAGGFGLDAQWDDDVHHAIHAAVSGERQGYYADFGSFACLAKVLCGGFFHDGTYSSFRRRHHGRPIPVDHVPASRLVVFTCNHDQIGNRAIGDRPTAYLDSGQIAITAALVVLSPFTPMLFQGEEWAARTPFQYFTSHPEPELADAVRTGRRAEFAEHGWHTEDVPDPQDPETFRRSTLDWSEPAQPEHAAMLDFYRSLISLRSSESELSDGSFASVTVTYDADAGWFAMHRRSWSIVCNLGTKPVGVPLNVAVALAWGDYHETGSGLALAAHTVAIGRRVTD